MKIKILDSATLGADVDLSRFSSICEVEIYPITPREELLSRVADADICIINKVRFDRDVIDAAKQLRLICVAATGYDNIDTAYCREKGIAVCNVAGYSSNSVSQLTVAMVLFAATNLSAFRESVADGTYSRGSVQNILTPVYHELAGRTWGIIGYGGIGRKVGAVAEALGCRVVVNKRTTVDDVECLTLDALLSVSDIVTLHVPLTEMTRGMIGKRELSLMKNGAILVNVARGAVLDESAVCDAVESGKLGFFGCDVYSTEPMPESHPYYRIRSRENVCLTPHMAWGAYEARERCMDEIYKNIRAFLDGGRRNRIA